MHPNHASSMETRWTRGLRRIGMNLHADPEERRCTAWRTRRTLRAIGNVAVVAAVVAVVVVPWQRYFTFAQELTGLDTEAQGHAIIQHLSSVIQFYRAINQPIQKAGEPNDVVYRDQAVSQAAQVADYAFESARAEAALFAASKIHGQGGSAATVSNEQQRMQASQATVQQRISDLQARVAELDKQIATARPGAVAGLEAQKRQLQSALELANAMKQALDKIVGMSGNAGGTGLAADVARLQNSIPELQSKNKTSAPQLTTIQSALSAGVTSQATVLFQLVETRRSLASLIEDDDHLHQQALALRNPLSNILRNLVQQGQQLSEQAEQAVPAPAAETKAHGKTAKPPEHPQPAPAAPAANPEAKPASNAPPASLESITHQFKALAAATVPLSEEVIVLEESRANLSAWQTSAQAEYDSILHALVLRVFVIGIALLIIVGGGQVWTRATNKYVHDIRRRRQLLIVRRVVVGFLSAIVVLFGFVTQFHSLATFAGFITAGIAVGLQTILLSVAAYFFIIGRYGIKVGDRITVASVTGDVIDVGLVRFYVMELAGAGIELNPTGRVAVFSNAVLFQAGTPLYKQLPGSGYHWHELTVKLADGADYKMVCDAIVKEVRSVFDGYRSSIEQQHRTVQNWMQTSIDPPQLQSRLQFSGGAFQFWVRFPVEIARGGEIDEKITRALLDCMAANPAIKSAVAATPSIQPSVRG